MLSARISAMLTCTIFGHYRASSRKGMVSETNNLSISESASRKLIS